MKHTPGPWRAENWACNAPTSIKAADGTYIAECGFVGRLTDDSILDAQLIALAPEMKAALDAIVQVWDRQCGRVFESMGSDNPRAMAIDEAIEKARSIINPQKPQQ